MRMGAKQVVYVAEAVGGKAFFSRDHLTREQCKQLCPCLFIELVAVQILLCQRDAFIEVQRVLRREAMAVYQMRMPVGAAVQCEHIAIRVADPAIVPEQDPGDPEINGVIGHPHRSRGGAVGIGKRLRVLFKGFDILPDHRVGDVGDHALLGGALLQPRNDALPALLRGKGHGLKLVVCLQLFCVFLYRICILHAFISPADPESIAS